LVAAHARENQFASQDDPKQPTPTKCEEPSVSHGESPVPQPSFPVTWPPGQRRYQYWYRHRNAKDGTANGCAIDR
jgi:hypothetical protein